MDSACLRLTCCISAGDSRWPNADVDYLVLMHVRLRGDFVQAADIGPMKSGQSCVRGGGGDELNDV